MKHKQINSIFAEAFDREINGMLNVLNHNDEFSELTQTLKWIPNKQIEGQIYWGIYVELSKKDITEMF